MISDKTKELVEKLLLERLSIASISRVLHVPEKWLQIYLNDKYRNIEKKVKVTSKKRKIDNSM